MVERVARAICRSTCLGDPGKVFLDANWPRYADAARAAIEEIQIMWDKRPRDAALSTPDRIGGEG
jgi:hypothetical protein